MASCFQAKFGKESSTVRLFTVNLPEPARRNTRAIDSLRRPVPRNQFVPAMGVPVELNDPPKLTDSPGKPEPANFTPRVARQAVAHLFEGRAGSLLDEGRHRNVRKSAWRTTLYHKGPNRRLEYCRLPTHQNNNPRDLKRTAKRRCY